MVDDRYFVKVGEGSWRECAKKEFVHLERQAGFHNTLGQPNEPATGGFSGSNIQGRPISPNATRDQYAWDDEFAEAVWPSTPKRTRLLVGHTCLTHEDLGLTYCTDRMVMEDCVMVPIWRDVTPSDPAPHGFSPSRAAHLTCSLCSKAKGWPWHLEQ